jgi:threonine/homoserine efflux transporter RhtA
MKLLNGGSGKTSSTRLITLIVVGVILAVYIGHNVVSMFKGGAFIDFPSQSVMVLLIVMGAKVGQHVSEATRDKHKEKKHEEG